MADLKLLWASAAAVREAAQTAWERGHVLRELHVDECEWQHFPRKVRLAGPKGANEVAENLSEINSWARELRAAASGQGWRLETRTMSAGALGRQTVPVNAWLDTPQMALGVLGRSASSQAETFAGCLEQVGERPAAGAVALAQPHTVVAAAADWPLLLDICDWVVTHPRPGVHIRQVPVNGVHTKLISTHEKLLSRLLEASLPADAVDPAATSFTGRFGFTSPDRQVLLVGPGDTLGLPPTRSAEFDAVFWPVAALAALDVDKAEIDTLLVTENKLSAETAPARRGRLALWGSGNEVGSVLAALPWLDRVQVLYWGDIDTHGLAILARVRQVAAHVRPVLMDLPTLLAHRQHWVMEGKQYRDTLPPTLTADETELYATLTRGALGDKVRLEQEYIRFDVVAGALL